IAKGAAAAKPPVDNQPDLSEGGSAAFRRNLESAEEWTDYELMLRTLKELQARPLLLSMPIHGPHYDQHGISLADREAFYTKVHALAQKYGLPIIEFANHDGDATFLRDFHDHPSTKGWAYFNEALDDFFHDRLAAQ